LIESFRGLNDILEFFPRLLRLAVNELFNLFELMDAENTPDISTVRACFLSEASRDTSVMLRELSRLNPFLHVHSRNRLFGSSGKVIAVFAILILLDDLVKIFFKVI
jgi:hypothetical protein